MGRATLSLAAVALVGLFTFQATTANAGSPNFSRNMNSAKVRGIETKPLFNFQNYNKIRGIDRKPIAGFGNGLEWGHGPVVLPPHKGTPVTWGGNPPRAPGYGCGHHHYDRWFFRYLCYFDFERFLTDFDYDFCY